MAGSAVQPAPFFSPWEPLPAFAPQPVDSSLTERIQLLVRYAMSNGPSFIEMMRQKQAGDANFSFLSPGGEGSDFFRWLLYASAFQLPPDRPLPAGVQPPHVAAAAAAPPPQAQPAPGPPPGSHYHPPPAAPPPYHPPGQPYPAGPYGAPPPPQQHHMQQQQQQQPLGAALAPPPPQQQHAVPYGVPHPHPGGHPHHHPPPPGYAHPPQQQAPAALPPPSGSGPPGSDPGGAAAAAGSGPATGPIHGPSFGLPPDVAAAFTSVLDSLAASKDSIKSSAAWFMAHLPHAGGLALAAAHRSVASADYDRQLHLIYLANDVLFKGLAQRISLGAPTDAVSSAFQPVIGAMLAAAYNTGGRRPDIHARLNKILTFWSEKQVYGADTMSMIDDAAFNTEDAHVLLPPPLVLHDPAQQQQQQQPWLQQQQQAPWLQAGPAPAAAAPPPASSGWGPPPPTAPPPHSTGSGWGPPQQQPPPPQQQQPPYGGHPGVAAPPPYGAPQAAWFPGAGAPGAPPPFSPHAPPGMAQQGVAPGMPSMSTLQAKAAHIAAELAAAAASAAAAAAATLGVIPLGNTKMVAPLPGPDLAGTPVPSTNFPPGLIPALVRDKNKCEVPYTPMDPADIEKAGLPAPPDKDSALLARLDRLYADLRDFKPGMSRADLDDAIRGGRIRSRSQEPEEGGEDSGWRRKRAAPTGPLADGSFAGGRHMSMHAGLGAHSADNDPGGGGGGLGSGGGGGGGGHAGDMYSDYRKQLSGSYHEMIFKSTAAVVAPRRG